MIKSVFSSARCTLYKQQLNKNRKIRFVLRTVVLIKHTNVEYLEYFKSVSSNKLSISVSCPTQRIFR